MEILKSQIDFLQSSPIYPFCCRLTMISEIRTNFMFVCNLLYVWVVEGECVKEIMQMHNSFLNHSKEKVIQGRREGEKDFFIIYRVVEREIYR